MKADLSEFNLKKEALLEREKRKTENMGRPTEAAGKKQVAFYVSTAEKAEITRAAKERRMPVSVFVQTMFYRSFKEEQNE